MKIIKWIGIVIAVLLVTIVGWGLIEPRLLLDEQTETAELPNLPADWDGKKIAFLADLQVGMWLDNTGMVERVVTNAVESGADLIVIGGDFVYKPDSNVIDHAVELVRPLVGEGRQVVAVLGNHDYSMMTKDAQMNEDLAAELERKLEDAGILVLNNEAIDIGTGEPLYLVGIGSEWAGQSKPNEALSSLSREDPRIILMHNPVAYRDLPPATGALSLAAHTHGGQIRLPLFDSESWLDIARSREVVADGWAESDIGAEGNRLYVNRGIGFSRIPIRFMCRPELTLITLKLSGGDVPAKNPE